MNILLINHYAGSPCYGMEFRPYYMARSLAELGHKMYVLGANQSHLRKVQPAIGFEVIDDVDYCWLESLTYTGNGFGRVKNIFSFLYKACRKYESILSWSKPDVIVASSTYPMDNLLAHFLAKKCGAKVIYEVHDLWPLSPMEIGGLSKWHPFIILLQFSENYAYRNCDQLISMLPNTLAHVTSHGLDKDKFNYIPNGVFVNGENKKPTLLPVGHRLKLKELKKQDKLIIGYAGGHALSNALDSLLDAAAMLPNINFILMGSGIEKKRLVTRVTDEQLNNVHFLGPVDKDAVPEFLNVCDILTLVWSDSPLYRFGVSPNKVFDYMLVAKPIVQALTAPMEPVTLSGGGITVDTGRVDLLVEAFKKVADMSKGERIAMGESGKLYVLNNHSYNKLVQVFIDVCEKSLQ